MLPGTGWVEVREQTLTPGAGNLPHLKQGRRNMYFNYFKLNLPLLKLITDFEYGQFIK